MEVLIVMLYYACMYTPSVHVQLLDKVFTMAICMAELAKDGVPIQAQSVPDSIFPGAISLLF